MTATSNAPIHRSAALDVTDIDVYLCRLLLPRFKSLLKHFPAQNTFDHDVVCLLLHVALLSGSMAQTPGTLSSGLRVENIGRFRLFSLILLSIGGPFVFERLKRWLVQMDSDGTRVMTEVERVGLERRRTITRRIVAHIEMLLPSLRLAALLGWWSGETKAPSLAMALCGLSLVSERPPHNLNVIYAHRRWLYEELIKTLRAVSPMLTASDLAATLLSLTTPITKCLSTALARRQPQPGCPCCPLCNQHPITVSKVADCGHVYCYTCLWAVVRPSAEAKRAPFRCKVCGNRILNF